MAKGMILLNALLLLVSQELELDSLMRRVLQFEKSNRLDSALIIAYNGIENSRVMEDATMEAEFYIRCGTILCKSMKLQEGIVHYKKAYEMGESIADIHLQGKSLLGVGTAYYSLGHSDSALYYYNRSMPLLEKAGDEANVAGLQSNMALVLDKIGDPKEAEEFFLRSIAWRKGNDDSTGLAGSYFNLGRLYHHRNNHELALLHYARSAAIATAAELMLDARKAEMELAKINVELGRSDQAIAHFLRADSISIANSHMDYQDRILELETRFKTSEIERDNALKQLTIEEQQQNLILLMALTALTVMIIMAVYFYNEQRKKALRALAAKQQEVNNRKIGELLSQQEIKTAYALLEGQDRERNRIARELHDNISSTMVTMSMFLQSFNPKSLSSEESTILEKVTNIAEKATEDTRRLSHSLDTGPLKHFGLKSAIRDLVEAVERTGETTVTLTEDLVADLPAEISLNVYRIIQELINNTLRHANATQINLEVTQIKGDNLNIIYEDNGVGFDASAPSEGMGIRNIRSRAEKLDGQVTIESGKQRTTFIVEIPLKEQKAQSV